MRELRISTEVKNVLDVGANYGLWTKHVAMYHFPNASVFMIEANHHLEGCLERTGQ